MPGTPLEDATALSGLVYILRQEQRTTRHEGEHVSLSACRYSYVIYDISVIENLVDVTQSLCWDLQSPNKQYLVSKRNITTSELFRGHLKNHNIHCEWLARGSDCESLPRIFYCKFNQRRSDICMLPV